MATLQPILEEEWERHKDVLKDMYCAKKLPLQSRKGKENDPGVIELMKDTHGFVASPSQYELQFKKWGFAKNLKSGEWAALISQYDLLCQIKSDVRITVSGSVLSKNKIHRARRRYRPRRNGAHGVLSEDGNLPASRQAHVEFLDEVGGWKKYSSTSVNHSNALVLHKSSDPARLAPLLSDHLDHQDLLKAQKNDTDPYMVHIEEVDAVSSHNSNTAYRPFSHIFHFDEDLTNPMQFLGSPDFAHPHPLNVDDSLFSSLPSGSSIFHGPLGFPSFLETPTDPHTQKGIMPDNDHLEMALERTMSAPRTQSHLEGARSLIQSLVQHRKITQCFKSDNPTEAEIPDVEEIIESLESLLPDTESPSREVLGLTLSLKNASSFSTLFKTLIYSFTNNFAGLRHVPREALMQLLREHHDIRTQLFEVVKNGPPGVAKPLADSIFRAAVEGCDADAVATIIHHTKGNPKIAIDPNEIICNLEGNDYTPIEVAAKFRNTELVRLLVTCNADPNKTCKRRQTQWWDHGALALALGHWLNGSEHPYKPSPPGEPKPVDLDLLRLLLDCGAEPSDDLTLNAVRPGPGNTEIAEELMSRIPASDHWICFENEWLAVSIIHYLENMAACRIIKRFITHCVESDDCGTCVSDNPRLVEEMLCHAARRANLDLCKLLVQHTAQLQSSLAAAVRSESDELIEFFLDRGAPVDDPVKVWCRGSDTLWDENGYDRVMLSQRQTEYVITPIRTPLAEAIRTRNDRLINTFERLGALTRLAEHYHFHAAVFASAEVGNTSYLEMLLDHAPQLSQEPDLALALAIAIRNDETDAALILLDAGARPRSYSRMHGNPLVSALERCNTRVVDSMLESDLDFQSRDYEAKHPLEVAATWCELQVIEDLIFLGAPINIGAKTTPLAAAVKSRNEALVRKLLDLGANPRSRPLFEGGISPLRAAVEIGDYDMARFLISRGTSSADYAAFVYAMRHDQTGYEFLLTEFKSQYPHGLEGFHGRLLVNAIQLDSHTVFDSLLKAGADVNSWYKSLKPAKMVLAETERIERVLGFAIQHQKGRHLELVRKLLLRGAEADAIVTKNRPDTASGPTWIFETPLLLAIKKKNQEMVSLLLEYGADLNRPARRGVKRTPLQAACETGSHKMVEYLLQRGARVNEPAADRYGVTALQMAAKTGSLRIAKLLLDNGADPYLPKSKVEGRTAFEAAAESGCIDILLLLWNAAQSLGFSEKECQSAKDLARRKGHRGCVDFIDLLSGGSSPSLLVDDFDISNFI